MQSVVGNIPINTLTPKHIDMGCRLKARKGELESRLRCSLKEVKKLYLNGDTKAVRSKMSTIRKLQCQKQNIAVSLETIENNVDEIANSDMTQDIINSLKRSTEAMKLHCVPAGGVDGIQETMDDLQTELQNAAEITDIIHKGTSAAVNSMMMSTKDSGRYGMYYNYDDQLQDGYETGDDPEMDGLVKELNYLLRDSDVDELPAFPQIPSSDTRSNTTPTAQWHKKLSPALTAKSMQEEDESMTALISKNNNNFSSHRRQSSLVASYDNSSLT